MGRMIERLRSIWHDRRQRDDPVAIERRGKPTRKQVEKRFDEAFEDLEQTVRLHRDDLIKFSANDVQQEVQFHTFRDICSSSLVVGQHRLCRHPRHEAANTGIAKCDQAVCPFMLGKATA